MTSVSPYLSIHSVLVARKINKTLFIPVQLSSSEPEERKIVETTLAMIDSGAGGTFIDRNYAKKIGIPLEELQEPLCVYNVDGTMNKTGTITHAVRINININGRQTLVKLFVTGLGKQKIILGFLWLEKENPDINWRLGML